MKALRSIPVAAVLGVLMTVCGPVAAGADLLQDRDVIAICGDSITDQKLYSVYVADYLLMCTPARDLRVIQFGWPGEKADEFLGRVENDVLLFRPTVATVCYGMNDGGYAAPLETVRRDTYKTSLEGIVRMFRGNGVRVIVLASPTVVDTATFRPGSGQAEPYNGTLGELSDVTRDVATAEGVMFADVHGTLLGAMQQSKTKYGQDFPVAGRDGVHAGPNGHLAITYAILKGLGCEGDIGAVTVNVLTGTARTSSGQRVISCTNGIINLESSRYPFCFFGDAKTPDGTRSMVDIVPFNRELNRLMLTVTGISKAQVRVSWGAASKVYPAADLARGINLAAEFPDNPFCARFLDVERLIRAEQVFETEAVRGAIHSRPTWAQVVPADRDKLEQMTHNVVQRCREMGDAARAAIQPVRHTIKIEALP